MSSQDWCCATNLEERASLIDHRGQYDSDAAQRRFAQWSSRAPFHSDDYLRRRLALIGLNQDQFLQILGEPIEMLQGRVSTPWLRDVEEAFLDNFGISDSLPQSITEVIRPGFVRPFEPLVRLARQRLRVELQQLVRDHSHRPFEPLRVEELLLRSLVQQFAQIVSRTFVLELNIARMEGHLTGQIPEERFESFLQLLSTSDEALRLLSEYPVLARQLVTSVDHWLSTSVEVLYHLCTDWSAIREGFSNGSDPGILEELWGGAGDTHREGRSVHIVRFTNGLRVVYKPRSLAIDVHFQELLGWLNDHGARPRLPLTIVLDRGDHGWQEFVTPATCGSKEAVARFYAREGAYLAVLYLLAGTDFHYENLIAAGESPVLIDLEAIFHPRLFSADLREAEYVVASELRSSVVATGLLPFRIGANEDSEGMDISGMGAWGGQLSPWGAPQIEGAGTDHMCFVRKQVVLIAESANQPTLDGAEVNVLDYRGSLLDGFAHTYRLLLAYRDELLSEEGPLLRFRQDEIRVILRPTRSYAQLLFESYHPDVLRDALDRDRLFDRLWVAAPSAPHLEQVITREHADLWKGDIPIFTTRPGSRDLWHAGHERLPDFFPDAPISGHRAAQLSEADLARQVWFIGASLTTLSGATQRMRSAKANGIEQIEPVAHDDLLTAACACGDRLLSLAYRGEGDASWLGLSYIDERRPQVLPVTIDLYEGLSGITLFLAHLGVITRDPRYSELARAALATVKRNIEKSQRELTSIGGFAGWGGIIYTLSQLAALWDSTELFDQAESLAKLLPALIEKDKQLDLIGGSAGCIAGLLALYRARPSDHLLATAVQCGERLLSQSRPMSQGIGWLSTAGPEPLAGVSHGASGFAFALFSLFVAAGEQRFRTAGLQAIDYERSLFRKEAGNWVDRRQSTLARGGDQEARDRFCIAWCHGAPGIGLIRLKLLPYLKEDPLVYEEIHTALDTTASQGFAGDHSLCHGNFGNLEVFLEASQILTEPRWKVELSRFTKATLDSIQRDGWICGVPHGIEVPGLMTGLAGIGYELLRLAEPGVVPPILSLEPVAHTRAGAA
jgi:type 2 lantibiotic biosynthesis protein LanM